MPAGPTRSAAGNPPRWTPPASGWPGGAAYFKAVQFFFYDQWTALKAYANGKGVRLIGDIPIYVSPDSSDLWTRPELFQTDGQVHLTRVAGCPPDSFAADGPAVGQPALRWPRHEAEGFAWWKQRMRHATSIYDVVRIDHFRGFESYFSIPAGSATAQGGAWVKGPGQAFLDAMHQAVGRDAVIAEDLGYLTDEVKALLAASGCPGMKIMQFAFDSREPGNYLPYTYTAHSVVYTGTHDNITTEGWQQTASSEDVAYACRYLRCEPAGLTDANDLRLPGQRGRTWRSSRWRTGCTWARRPASHPQHPERQLALASGQLRPHRRPGRAHRRADQPVRARPGLNGHFSFSLSFYPFCAAKAAVPPCPGCTAAFQFFAARSEAEAPRKGPPLLRLG